jgi:hypothetical protein
MAALTPTSINTYSLGSVKLLQMTITTLTGSGTDTWTLPSGSPVLFWWSQNNNGVAGSDSDIQWNATTGIFTFTNGSAVGANLFMVALAAG